MEHTEDHPFAGKTVNLADGRVARVDNWLELHLKEEPDNPIFRLAPFFDEPVYIHSGGLADVIDNHEIVG